MVLTYSEQEIRIWLGRSDDGAVHSYGIEYNGLYYNNDELSDLRRHIERNKRHVNVGRNQISRDRREGTTIGLQPKVLFKYDPNDVGRIWVLDPIASLYLEVPAVFQEYAAGMTLRRHKLNLQYAKQISQDTVDEETLLKAHHDLTRMIASMSLDQAARLGKSLARAALVIDKRTPAPQPPPDPEPVPDPDPETPPDPQPDPEPPVEPQPPKPRGRPPKARTDPAAAAAPLPQPEAPAHEVPPPPVDDDITDLSDSWL